MGSSPSKDRPSTAPNKGSPQTKKKDVDTITQKTPAKRPTSSIKSESKKNGKIVYRQTDGGVKTTVTNALFEQIFLITTGTSTGEGVPEQCVLVPQVARAAGISGQLTQANIEEAVFERLLAASSRPFKMVHSRNDLPDAGRPKGTVNPKEPEVLRYLYHCFVRWKVLKDNAEYSSLQAEVEKCKTVIFQNTKTCLQQPDLFKDQKIHEQYIGLCIDSGDLLLNKESKINQFMMETAAMMESERGCMKECLAPVLTTIHNRFQKFQLMNALEVGQHIRVLRVFAQRESLAKTLMEHSEPSDWALGRSYEHTLLGSLLSMNPCPRDSEGPYEFFMDAVDSTPQEVHTTIMFLWQRLNEICEGIHKVLVSIIRLSSDLRHQVLNWIGRCLEANRGKPDVWSAHEAEIHAQKFCTDGFSLNLAHVMLQMCAPFATVDCDKLLKIKPSYCHVVPRDDAEAASRGVHARGLSKESTFIPYTDAHDLGSSEESYHFICECFFLAHQSLHIAYSIVHKIIKLNGSISRLRKIHEQIKNVYPNKVVLLVRTQLRKEICWYLNMKSALTEYNLTKMCLKFNITTASWLAQVATRDDVTDFQPIALPLSDDVPKSLAYLPEFIMTNLTIFVSSLDIFNGMELLIGDKAMLNQFVTLVLVYMGSRERLASSDARAKLAEAFESIVPNLNESDGTFKKSQSGNEEAVLHEHQLISHLAGVVVDVFVSIEMTGQSVDDEKKYNYRKSMHLILQYIWRVPVHKQAVKALSEQALRDINNPSPPLFLRFINLLVNDAIFLLDEVLDLMKQIRVQELDRDEGKWNSLSAEQMRDKETGLRQLSMMGRYRNIMANHTIYTLEIIAREIRPIFCHDVMVDRIAGMLNYFLEHLVTSKQRDYKVKDRKELEFKPEQIVSDITHIYVYLGSDDNFCKAVLGETRSFSHNLFDQAISVLQKIGIPEDFIKKFKEIDAKLKSMEVSRKQEEDMIADAPDEFMDPIMGTLMTDPVTLPSSKTNIDRAVIARHLLSDQRDPFTNMPLSMDQVVTNTELKSRIEDWKRSKSKS